METGGCHCLAKQGRSFGALVDAGTEAAGLECKHLAWGAVRAAAHTALSGDTVQELGLEGHALIAGLPAAFRCTFILVCGYRKWWHYREQT